MKAILPSLVFCVACSLVTGCASLPSTIEPIQVNDTLPFECTGWIKAGHNDMMESFQANSDTKTARKVVTVDAHLLRLKRTTEAELLGGGSVGMLVAPMKTLEMQALVKALVETETALAHNHLHTVINNGTRGVFTYLSQMSYVSGFTTMATTGAYIANPEVSVLDAGLVLEVAPDVVSQGRAVVLDLLITSVYPEEFKVVSVPYPESGQEVFFEVPVLTGQTVKTKPKIPVGGSFLVSGLIAANPDEVGLAFITVTAVETSASHMLD